MLHSLEQRSQEKIQSHVAYQWKPWCFWRQNRARTTTLAENFKWVCGRALPLWPHGFTSGFQLSTCGTLAARYFVLGNSLFSRPGRFHSFDFYWYFRLDTLLGGGDHLTCCKVFSNIPGFYPLDADSVGLYLSSLSPDCDNQKCFQHAI